MRDALEAAHREIRSLKKRLEAFQKRNDELEFALAPRLKSILALRPLRYALSERNRIKAGGAPKNAVSHAETDSNALIASVRRRISQRSITETNGCVEQLGIAVFAYDRPECVVNVLEALRLQNALEQTHVWIDGDHNNITKQAEVDFVHDCVRHYPVKAVHRNRGNFGFRKMMLLAGREMMRQYDRVLFLEDDCFPTQNAVRSFNHALSATADDLSILSVYGHPFGIPQEEKGSARFQGWGWAAISEKLQPVWEDLMECYLMTEAQYLDFVEEHFTAELERAIDITPGRQPSDTLKKFFAWDETLGLLAAMRGMRHQLTPTRTIYNFGAGLQAAHFSNLNHYRDPPFNMIDIDELWDRYAQRPD